MEDNVTEVEFKADQLDLLCQVRESLQFGPPVKIIQNFTNLEELIKFSSILSYHEDKPCMFVVPDNVEIEYPYMFERNCKVYNFSEFKSFFINLIEKHYGQATQTPLRYHELNLNVKVSYKDVDLLPRNITNKNLITAYWTNVLTSMLFSHLEINENESIVLKAPKKMIIYLPDEYDEEIMCLLQMWFENVVIYKGRDMDFSTLKEFADCQ